MGPSCPTNWVWVPTGFRIQELIREPSDSHTAVMAQAEELIYLGSLCALYIHVCWDAAPQKLVLSFNVRQTIFQPGIQAGVLPHWLMQTVKSWSWFYKVIERFLDPSLGYVLVHPRTSWVYAISEMLLKVLWFCLQPSDGPALSI